MLASSRNIALAGALTYHRIALAAIWFAAAAALAFRAWVATTGRNRH
jgi:hypothetical protein